jgi:hypothetical protein
MRYKSKSRGKVLIVYIISADIVLVRADKTWILDRAWSYLYRALRPRAQGSRLLVVVADAETGQSAGGVRARPHAVFFYLHGMQEEPPVAPPVAPPACFCQLQLQLQLQPGVIDYKNAIKKGCFLLTSPPPPPPRCGAPCGK